MSKNTNVSHWIDLVKAGDPAAANRIWQHNFDRLVRSVRARLFGQNRAVSDDEDIVLSVFDKLSKAMGKSFDIAEGRPQKLVLCRYRLWT